MASANAFVIGGTFCDGGSRARRIITSKVSHVAVREVAFTGL